MQAPAADSITDGAALMHWLVEPLAPEDFWEGVHEQYPLLIRRAANRAYYRGLFSKDGAWGGGPRDPARSLTIPSPASPRPLTIPSPANPL